VRRGMRKKKPGIEKNQVFKKKPGFRGKGRGIGGLF